jgi:hypothetical protein
MGTAIHLAAVRLRVTLAEPWSEHDALAAWHGKKLQGLESPAVATFTNQATGRTLAAGAAEEPNERRRLTP